MTLAGAFALFGVMIALAALPSSSVLLVVAQSGSRGVRSGVAAALGVVAGDLVFVMLAVLGMTALAEQMGAVFAVLKYLAAGYLIWLGIGLLRSLRETAAVAPPPVRARGLVASFGSGLLLTLGDLKAIFFYASLLPAFLDLTALTAVDVWILIAITVLAVGGVKVAYALGAGRASGLAQRFALERPLKGASGGLMIGAGAYLLVRD